VRSLVILAASVFDISSGKTNRQSALKTLPTRLLSAWVERDRQTNRRTDHDHYTNYFNVRRKAAITLDGTSCESVPINIAHRVAEGCVVRVDIQSSRSVVLEGQRSTTVISGKSSSLSCQPSISTVSRTACETIFIGCGSVVDNHELPTQIRAFKATASESVNLQVQVQVGRRRYFLNIIVIFALFRPVTFLPNESLGR